MTLLRWLRGLVRHGRDVPPSEPTHRIPPRASPMDCERVMCPRPPPWTPTFAVYDLMELRVNANEAQDGTLTDATPDRAVALAVGMCARGETVVVHEDSCTLTDDPSSVCSCNSVDLAKPEELQ